MLRERKMKNKKPTKKKLKITIIFTNSRLRDNKFYHKTNILMFRKCDPLSTQHAPSLIERSNFFSLANGLFLDTLTEIGGCACVAFAASNHRKTFDIFYFVYILIQGFSGFL